MESGTSGDASEPSFDLFDRWLAHREQQASDVAQDVAAPPRAPTHPAGPISDPLFDENFVPFDGEPVIEAAVATELDFELAPVDPAPVEVAPVEPVPPEPVLIEPARSEPVLIEPAPPEPAPAKPAPVEPAPVEVAIDRPEPHTSAVRRDTAREVFEALAATGTETASAPVVPRPLAAPLPRPMVVRVPHTQPRPVEPAPPVAASVAPAPPPVPTPPPERPPAAEPTPARTPAPEPSSTTAAALPPTVVEFAPRSGTRRLVGLLLLVVLAAAVVAGYVAWQQRTTPTIGTAVTLAALTAIIWAVRTGSSIARLTVRGGQLEILRAGSRHQFDLTSHYSPIEVVGTPGGRGWKVLIQRRGMAPYVIDASMVDPQEFMRVLRRYRPED